MLAAPVVARTLAAGGAGTIVSAISCQRIDATHVEIVLRAALRNASSSCHLFYPYGTLQIGRGNAVIDNFSAMPMQAGWNVSADLGTGWNLDFPLAATSSGIPLSDTPI
jgi:hypothetical protein